MKDNTGLDYSNALSLLGPTRYFILVPPRLTEQQGFPESMSYDRARSAVVRPRWDGLVELLKQYGYAHLEAILEALKKDEEENRHRIISLEQRENRHILEFNLFDVLRSRYGSNSSIEDIRVGESSDDSVAGSRGWELIPISTLHDDGSLKEIGFNLQGEQEVNPAYLQGVSPIEDALESFTRRFVDQKETARKAHWLQTLISFRVQMVSAVMLEARYLGVVKPWNEEDAKGTQTNASAYMMAMATVLFGTEAREDENGDPVIQRKWGIPLPDYKRPSKLFEEMHAVLHGESDDGPKSPADSVMKQLRRLCEGDNLIVAGETIEYPGGGKKGLDRWIEVATQWYRSKSPDKG